MATLFFRAWNKLATLVSLPIIASIFFQRDTGKDHGVGFFAKLNLLFKMRSNSRKITTASHFLEHLTMATQILRVPPTVEGCVVECGTFKGGSAANLSLVCAMTGRQLEVFDSFEGLPEPSAGDQEHLVLAARELHSYAKGAWAGTLEEVKQNIRTYGNIGVCNFNVGYFADTLPRFNRSCVLAFLDVDLVESLQACVRNLWPLLRDGCYLFTHEAHHTQIAGFFHDQPWWLSTFGTEPPGLIGGGTGLGLQAAPGGFSSALGYTVKSPRALELSVNPQTGALGCATLGEAAGSTRKETTI